MLLSLFSIHRVSRVADTLPKDNLSATQHIAQSVAITAAVIGVISAIVFLWADYMDRKGYKELKRKK